MRSDTAANGQVITFLVAGVLFLAAVGTVLLFSRGAGTQDRGAAEASQQQQAGRLADLLVDSQGIGWAAGADAIGRLGLRATNGSGLQESSLDALRGSLFPTTANGKVDYDDARASLGLAGSQDFHISMYPIGMKSVYKAADSRMRTAYIGDWLTLPPLVIPSGTHSSEKAAAQAALNLTMDPTTSLERLALRNLGLDYDDRVYIGVASPSILVDRALPLLDIPLLQDLGVDYVDGDIYPDVKTYLDLNLAPRLANYDLLVVGSGVRQSSMTADGVKGPIRDWVWAGGTLVVLGSSDLNYQWLQPLLSTGIKTANGAASAPDPTHPILQEPHVLDWTRYNDHGVTWDIKAQSAEKFNDVIVKGGNDVLALSNEGAFGAGRIILTTYLPREIAATLGQAEAEHLLENFILFTDHAGLFLEYGATQPDGVPIAVAVRQSHVYDPTLGQVPVRIEVHFWGSA